MEEKASSPCEAIPSSPIWATASQDLEPGWSFVHCLKPLYRLIGNQYRVPETSWIIPHRSNPLSGDELAGSTAV
jgi:hypothetical protein